jgi:hypothetical protein
MAEKVAPGRGRFRILATRSPVAKQLITRPTFATPRIFPADDENQMTNHVLAPTMTRFYRLDSAAKLSSTFGDA